MKTEELIRVEVHVPQHHLADLYRWAAAAQSDGFNHLDLFAETFPNLSELKEPVPFTEADDEVISNWWAKLSGSAKEAFNVMATHPNRSFTGVELAEACSSLSGPSEVAGTFNWPSRFAKKLGIGWPYLWDGETRRYSMTAAAASKLLAAVGARDDRAVGP